MTLVGSNHPGRTQFESALGIPMDYVRCFNENDAQTHASAGRAVIVTTKPSFSDSASTRDQKLTALANKYKAFGKPGYFGVWHEPENDIDSGNFTRAQYITMQKAVNDVMGPILRPLGWKMIQIFMGFHFPGGTGGSWDIKPLILATTEALGSDAYMWRGANQGCAPWACADQTVAKTNINQIYAPALDYGTSIGKEVLLTEFGITARQSDTSFAEVTQLMAGLVTWHAARPTNSQYAAVIYFWQGPPGFPPEWRHVNAAGLAEFKKFRTGTVTPPPPPGETDAQKIARLTAELAAAEASLTACGADNDSLTSQLLTIRDQRDALQVKIDKAKADLA